MSGERTLVAAEDDAVLCEFDAGLCTVTLNRPTRGNAFSASLVEGLDAALDRAEADGTRALVLRGNGKHFCTGFDLGGLEEETDDTLLARFVRIELLLQRIARAPFVTAAIAQGRAMGAGADLFAACALRVIEGDATFAFPGARGFGLVLGTRRLAQCVGRDTALDWVESGRSIATDEALRAGLVLQRLDAVGDVRPMIEARQHDDAWLRRALRQAADPGADAEDARDLSWLVRSAARKGLRARIEQHVNRVKATRT